MPAAGSLTEIIEDQAELYIDPGEADIPPAAMSEIAVQGFGARGTQENGAKDPETFVIVGQQLDGIMRLRARKIPRSSSRWLQPSTASMVNQMNIIGPKSFPIDSVPNC